MEEEEKIPKLLEFLFGEGAERAQRGALSRLLRWSEAFRERGLRRRVGREDPVRRRPLLAPERLRAEIAAGRGNVECCEVVPDAGAVVGHRRRASGEALMRPSPCVGAGTSRRFATCGRVYLCHLCHLWFVSPASHLYLVSCILYLHNIPQHIYHQLRRVRSVHIRLS